MARSRPVKVFMLLIQLAAIMVLMSAGVATATEAISFSASEPYAISYTTNGTSVSAPVGAAPATSSQTRSASPESVENRQKNSVLKNRLQKKYDLDRSTLAVSLEHTQYGPKGYINLIRNISSDNAADTKDSTGVNEINHSRVNAIVLEFLTEEADLFGITSLDEWRETGYATDGSEFTMIEFQRYINQLPMEYSFIKFFVRSTGQIYSVSAELVPAPPELYETAKKEALPEERIRVIAEETLLKGEGETNTDTSAGMHLKVEKIALSTPPYVLWKVEGNGTIYIDPFTGKVLRRNSGLSR